jgi:hypothetical protein
MEQPGNINITPVNRAFLQEQGILKGMGSQIKKRKMQKKPMQEMPKKKAAPKPTAADIAFSKKSGISLSDVMAQGGVTPSSVSKQIKDKRAYDVKFGPGLYKPKSKKSK